MSVDPQKFCLKWNDYRHSVTTAFEGLRQDEELVDMTLCCEGRKIKAHRMMMSACSPFFRDLLKENPCRHPVFFLRDVSYQDLWSAIEFVYKGEVNVSQANLASFLKTAEMLQLRGLTDDDKGTPGTPGSQPPASAASPRPASAESRRQTDGGAGWEAESAEPAPRPAKRPRTQHTAAPPPPPPPAAPAAALDPVAVKRETPPPPPPPPPPFAPMGDVGYGAEQEPDPGLRTILYHDQASGPPGMSVDPDGPAAGDPISLQLLEADQAIEAFSGPDDSLQQTYSCEECGKAYRHRNSLTKHRKVHLGQTECHECSTVFSSKWMLSYHLKHSRCARSRLVDSR